MSAAKHSFREALFETFNDLISRDEEDRTPLSDTYEVLLELKPNTRFRRARTRTLAATSTSGPRGGSTRCPCPKRRAHLFHGRAAHSRTLPGLGIQR